MDPETGKKKKTNPPKTTSRKPGETPVRSVVW